MLADLTTGGPLPVAMLCPHSWRSSKQNFLTEVW